MFTRKQQGIMKWAVSTGHIIIDPSKTKECWDCATEYICTCQTKSKCYTQGVTGNQYSI